MKSYIFLGILFFSTLLASCSGDTAPTPKTYPVPAGAFAMNASMVNKDFNIQLNQNGWLGQTNRMWFTSKGINYVRHGVIFSNYTKINGDDMQINFHVSAPMIKIEDANNINASYTYEAFRNQFVVGKNYPMVTPTNEIGYRLLLYHVNLSNLDKSFNYMSLSGEQKDAKWTVTAIKELPRQGVLVTYDVNCNLFELNGNQYAGKFVGTIQVEYWYRPF
jgi:hypothetical protein